MHTVLWISAHPEPQSLNGHLRDDAVAYLHQHDYTVIESDLYAMNWDPVVRSTDSSGRQPAEVVEEQDKLRRADIVVIQFPLWWYGMPAILKGWFDRVFVSGFTFGIDPVTGRRLRFEQGPFVGKRALVVTTLGDRPQAIGPRGKSGELQELLFGLLHGTLAYTGMSVLPPWALPSADRVTDYDRVRDDLARRLDGLLTDTPIAYRPQFTGDYTDDWELVPQLRPGEHGVRVNVR